MAEDKPAPEYDPNHRPVKPYNPKLVGLPPRPFLYTADQIAGIIGVQVLSVETKYLYYEGRSIGFPTKNQMLARNIAPDNEKPEWRVAEGELIRWMRKKGFKFYERVSISAY